MGSVGPATSSDLLNARARSRRFLPRALSNQEIAEALFISVHTVKSHLKGIFQKTGAVSRTQAVARLAEDVEFRRVRRPGEVTEELRVR